jgi:quercetin dioxygenase-like cupin family protein
VVSVTLPPEGRTTLSASSGIEVTLDKQSRTLASGEGSFIAGGRTTTLKVTGDAPSAILHFFLGPATEFDQRAYAVPANARELYRTSAPIPGLKPGDYDLNLTRITFPPQMPSNPPHHRSGAALYYIVSGIGSNTVGGTTEAKGPGSLVYEPFDLVHQWGNPGSEPFTFLAFNINPDGVAAVLSGAPAKSQ